MRKTTSFAIALASVFSVTFVALADLGSDDNYLPYQGRIELNGVPVNEPVDVTFRFFNVASGGTALDTVTETVDPANGEFVAEVGPISDDTMLTRPLFVEMAVAGVTLSGRQQIAPVVAAQRADVATGPYLPRYSVWHSLETGEGGAAIYNDGTDPYRALMLIGNDSAGTGSRHVRVYDDLLVNGEVRLINTGGVDAPSVRAGSADVGTLNVTSMESGGSAAMILGGWYCSGGLTGGGAGSAGGSVNPLTGARTCPAGYTSSPMFTTGGIQNCDAAFGVCQIVSCNICWK